MIYIVLAPVNIWVDCSILHQLKSLYGFKGPALQNITTVDHTFDQGTWVTHEIISLPERGMAGAHTS